jgi:integrase
MGEQLLLEVGCSRDACVRQRQELQEARAQIQKLTSTVRDQAKAIAELTDDCPPAAPSLAIVYWLFSQTQSTKANWKDHWNRLIPVVNALGDIPAIKLTPMAWETHRTKRKQTAMGRHGRPIKDSILNVELSRTKELLKWAVNNKLIKYNPLASAKAHKTIGHRETWLGPEYVDRLLAAADDVVDKRLADGDDSGLRSKVLRAFILCCHDSMLRLNEARNLRRDRIGPDGRVELAASETKSRKRRTIFLTPRTLEAIAMLAPIPGCPFVFADQDGQIAERRIHYWFRTCAKLAGVDAYAAPGEVQIRPHDLRASGATTADEHGARAKALQDALGHAVISTTARYMRSEQSSNARTVATVIISATDPRRGAKRAKRKTAPVFNVRLQT